MSTFLATRSTVSNWRLITAVAIIAGIAGSGVQPVWAGVHPDLATAQRAAQKSLRNILVFVPGKNSSLSASFDKAFRNAELSALLVSGYELVQVDFDNNRVAASQLGVNQPGTVIIYNKDGVPVNRLTTEVSPEVLASILRNHARQVIPGLVPSPSIVPKRVRKAPSAAAKTPAAPDSTAKPSRTPALFAYGTPPPAIPRGRQVGNSIVNNLNSDAPMEFEALEAGKNYVLVLDGENSPWGGNKYRADALYIFDHVRKPGKIEIMPALRFKPSEMPVYEYLWKLTGSLPVYNPSHVYEVPLRGTGEKLVLYYHEEEPQFYDDNSGLIRGALYEAR